MKNLLNIFFFVTLFTCPKIILAVVPTYPVVIESDTKSILKQIEAKAKVAQIRKQPFGGILAWVGTQLVNSPYAYYLLDQKTPEYLYISLGNTDCMLFVEEVVVLSRLIRSNRLTIDNYIDGIKDIRYHGSVSYCNRNHYFKDWAITNEQRGLVRDVGLQLTGEFVPNNAYILGNTIADNESNIHHADLACIRSREKIIDQKNIGFIAVGKLPSYLKYIKDGDIIGVVSAHPTKSDSIRHLGFAHLGNKQQVGYLNASSLKGKVVIYASLLDYLYSHNDAGIVLLRPI